MTEPAILGKTVHGRAILVDADVIAKDGAQHQVGKPIPPPVKAEKVYHVEYELKHRFSTEELRSLILLAQRELPFFQLRSGKSTNNAELYVKGSLNKFTLPAGITMAGVKYVQGEFKPKSDPAREITEILQSAIEGFGRDAMLSTCCLFKALGFEQNQEPEKCGLLLTKGKLFIDYISSIDPAPVRQAYLSRLISTAGLPMQIFEDKWGYHFKHALAGEIKAGGAGSMSENPLMFWCEVAVSAVSELTTFIHPILSGASALVGGRWAGWPSPGSLFGFDSIVAKNYPCESFHLHFGYTFDKDILMTLEEMRTMKIKSGVFQTVLADFKLHETEGTFEVITNRKGHRLKATVIPKVLPELNRILNVNFTRSSG
ncbi:MAG: hypothetical protein HY298_27795 [Verrucomicrobia bacterium]|nr:hypothetical protein [Verrucomicrobiota bacterium]